MSRHKPTEDILADMPQGVVGHGVWYGPHGPLPLIFKMGGRMGRVEFTQDLGVWTVEVTDLGPAAQVEARPRKTFWQRAWAAVRNKDMLS